MKWDILLWDNAGNVCEMMGKPWDNHQDVIDLEMQLG